MPPTAKEVLKLLHKDGWIEVPNRTKGSHIQLKHPVKPGKVTVPMHSGDLPAGTYNSILKQAGLK
ncbi:MAG: type II toxin-antitoxin system HicA family toxin [Clostridia bacterium]|nr:type II toxin-antitoxin system HicA family toxin [Clostridia bacterium]